MKLKWPEIIGKLPEEAGLLLPVEEGRG